jgi:hypothetical protein
MFWGFGEGDEKRGGEMVLVGLISELLLSLVDSEEVDGTDIDRVYWEQDGRYGLRCQDINWRGFVA